MKQNAYRDFGRTQRQEVSLDCLVSEKHDEPFTVDSYFERQEKPTVFIVHGEAVVVGNERFANTVSKLPEQSFYYLISTCFLFWVRN
jgi:hypothetical protein